MTTLSEAERKLLEPFEYIACCVFQSAAHGRGEIPPTWLCASEEARQACRDEAVRLFSNGSATDPLARTMVSGAAVEHLRSQPQLWRSYETWVQAETDFKALREADPPNPRAFFAEYAR